MFKQFIIISFVIAALSVFFSEKALTILKSFTNSSSLTLKPNLFTVEELSKFNGIDKPQLYLALLGQVFDVTKGEKHYGPGKSYNFFIGKDASRSFISGEPEGENSDHVANLSNQDLRGIKDWLKFYKKEYKKVGKLIGKYYDEAGNLTPYGKQVKKLMKLAEEEKEHSDLDKIKYPPCNVEWDAEKGTRVWCTTKSGGIERSWTGYPRQLYEPGRNSYRCACISEDNRQGNIKEYEDCEATSTSCFVRVE